MYPSTKGKTKPILMKAPIAALFSILCLTGTSQIFDSLAWADEFNVDGGLDSAKWWHQTILPNNGQSWWNGEIQHYTNRDTNSYCENGYLYLTALKETFTDQSVTKDYTSARLNSKFAFTYGRVEVRAQLPTGAGTWPAIWMLGQNIYEIGAWWDTQGYASQYWPQCGEIDIMEHWGDNQDYVSSAMHTLSSYGGTINVAGRSIPGVSTSFHTYAVEWTPTKMVFSVDSIVHYTYEPTDRTSFTWPFDNPQYLLLNIAIQSNIDANFTSSPMILDYVRVYQSSTLSDEELEYRSITIYPNPAKEAIKVRQPWSKAEIIIYDLKGTALLEHSLKVGDSNIDVSSLPAGSYMCKIVNLETGSFTEEKIIKL